MNVWVLFSLLFAFGVVLFAHTFVARDAVERYIVDHYACVRWSRGRFRRLTGPVYRYAVMRLDVWNPVKLEAIIAKEL